MKNNLDMAFKHIEENNEKLRKLFFDIITENAILIRKNERLWKKIKQLKGK